MVSIFSTARHSYTRSEAQKLKTNGFFFCLDFAQVLDVLFFNVLFCSELKLL